MLRPDSDRPCCRCKVGTCDSCVCGAAARTCISCTSTNCQNTGSPRAANPKKAGPLTLKEAACCRCTAGKCDDCQCARKGRFCHLCESVNCKNNKPSKAETPLDVKQKSSSSCCKCRIGFCDDCQCSESGRFCHSCVTPNCENKQAAAGNASCCSCTQGPCTNCECADDGDECVSCQSKNCRNRGFKMCLWCKEENGKSCKFCMKRDSSRIGQINCQSLRNKEAKINSLLNNLDVLGLCETWLDDDDCWEDYEVDGFKLERKDRQTGDGGGGVGFYIRDNLNYRRMKKIESRDVESIWIEEDTLISEKLLIGMFYRPPKETKDWTDLFEKQLKKASNQSKNILVMGDFNIDIGPIDHKGRSHPLMKLTKEYELEQLVEEVTRPAEKGGYYGTVIDLVFTNQAKKISDLRVPQIIISDHYPVIFRFK